MVWRPKGYASFQGVVGTILYHVELIVILSCIYAKNDEGRAAKFLECPPKEHRLGQAIKATVECGFASSETEAELALHVLTSILLIRYIEECPPVLVSLSGAEFELHAGFFWHRDQLELCHPAWPVFENPQFVNLRRCHDEAGFKASDLLDRFTFIDFDTETLKVKNGTRRHLENITEPWEVSEMMKAAKDMEGFRIFWESEPDTDDFLVVIEDLVSVPVLQRAVIELYSRGEDEAAAVETKVSDEFAAEREARSILVEDVEEKLRSSSLRDLVSIKIGERPWGRVTGRLRADFPHISKAGAPKKLKN